MTNNQDFVNFKKVRGLGDMLSDTFKFLRSEWQPFFITIIKIAIVPVIIAVAAAIYFLIESSYFYSGILNVNESEPNFNFNFSGIFLPLLAIVVSYLIAYALVTVASLSYIKSYIKNKGIVNYEEIQNDTKEKFWPYVGLFFLVMLIVFIGALFCFLPGIYFGVVLSLSICILIFQNKSVSDTIGYSFTLIKDHWWETFGILLIVQILIAILSFIVELPISLYQGVDISVVLENENPTEFFDYFTDPIYLILLAFANLVKFVFYIISTIVTVFIYFDIREQKNPTSDSVIDEIGMN
ncbi:hypothetical protein [Polaribacter sp.]|uniref:hypothetical protein n=1 Tax=Polaribacter sp. TaxID=1920175 RepID=UPI003F6C7ED9